MRFIRWFNDKTNDYENRATTTILVGYGAAFLFGLFHLMGYY